MSDRVPAEGHRLRLGRRSVTGQTYALTLCCADRAELFADHAIRNLVGELIEESVEYGFERVDAYVVMPDHVHVVCELGDSKSLARAMNDLKKIIARRVNDLVGQRGAVWQRGYFDHGIRSQADFERQCWYILGNPVRKGLAEGGRAQGSAPTGGSRGGGRAQGSAPTGGSRGGGRAQGSAPTDEGGVV